jgi:acyl-coenzyme A synthetase/AMP-(fatty) acid ligase
MSLRLPEPCSLAQLVRANNLHADADFIADDIGRASLLSLASGVASPSLIDRIRGKSVLVAVPRQLDAVAAMLLLDGIAGRMILWPPDEKASLDAVMALSGADLAITAWPLRDELADAPVTDPGATSAPVEPPAATEWVLFTSGSTGTPKMVVHCLQSLAGHLAASRSPGGTRPVWSTFYDVRRYGGLQILLRALVCGGSLVLSSHGEPQAAFLARAAAAGVTHILGTPSHWRRALMAPQHALITPVYVRLSGETAHQPILDQLKLAYPRAALVHAFASTEAGLGFEVSDGLAGFPAAFLQGAAAGVEIRVAGGTLHLRSQRVASQILGRTTVRPADEDGFVDTGDEVARVGDRYFFIGRRDGIINVGGQKVHPEEVEAVINQHPAVRMSLVKARRNPITGAIVVADVVSLEADEAGSRLHAGRSLEADIRAFCRRSLPEHKIPASIRLVPTLSISAAGKLVRPHA